MSGLYCLLAAALMLQTSLQRAARSDELLAGLADCYALEQRVLLEAAGSPAEFLFLGEELKLLENGAAIEA